MSFGINEPCRAGSGPDMAETGLESLIEGSLS